MPYLTSRAQLQVWWGRALPGRNPSRRRAPGMAARGGVPAITHGIVLPDRPRAAGAKLRPNWPSPICNTCPVRAECLEYALGANAQYGVFGGMAEEERREVRRHLARRFELGGRRPGSSQPDPAVAWPAGSASAWRKKSTSMLQEALGDVLSGCHVCHPGSGRTEWGRPAASSALESERVWTANTLSSTSPWTSNRGRASLAAKGTREHARTLPASCGRPGNVPCSTCRTSASPLPVAGRHGGVEDVRSGQHRQGRQVPAEGPASYAHSGEVQLRDLGGNALESFDLVL